MALDSDDKNPDAALWVQFYDDVRENSFKTAQEGRPIYEDCVKIRINVPSNSTLAIDREIEPGDSMRFPVQWAHYQNTRSGDAQGGTPIDKLPFLSKAVVETLRYAKFHSIEQLANAGDGALQNLGMSAGMDPLALRERCIRYLEGAKDNAAQTRLEHELQQRDAEIETLKGQMQQLIDLVKNQRLPDAGDATAEPEAKRGPGRPRREAEAA